MDQEKIDNLLGIFDGFMGLFKTMTDTTEKAFEKATESTKPEERLSSEELERFSAMVHQRYKIAMPVSENEVIKRAGLEAWFDVANPPMYTYYWNRYKQYLLNHKKWEYDTVTSIDTSTDEILSLIGDPNKVQSFDVRGLVLGYVQSGKTANFTGLINKAYDVGYKVVIVLAGMNNDLRAQTQVRLEEEVVGILDPDTKKKIGVASIQAGGIQVETWTTATNDISLNNAIGVRNLEKPILIVTKKNGDVLEALVEQLKASVELGQTDVPVLVIDDEADQASIDTANPKKSEKPKTINRLIRDLLNVFNRKSYVAYTATPFANLLIDASANHDEFGTDLYPKDFIIALPKPKAYCGPEEYFNTTGFEEDNKAPLVRKIRDDEAKLFDEINKSDKTDLFVKVPNTMKEAILAFLLSTSIRNLRKHEGQHNSMLIHVSRYTGIQSNMQKVINAFYKEMEEDITINKKSKYIEQLKKLYLEDYLKTQESYAEIKKEKIEIFPWEKVLDELKNIAGKVQVMEINGKSEHALEYNKYKKNGLNVIAIGGDKLSRGLTLEGLTVSYYYRSTSMYDTLMQMGRWFGYRGGYMDLCRIYTTDTIASYFDHLAEVMIELREEFSKLAKRKVTPEQYAVSMLSHPFMTITSPSKRRNLESSPYYNGSIQQTRSFELNEAFYRDNMESTKNFLEAIENPFESKGGSTVHHVVYDVKSKLVIDYLNTYRTAYNARVVDSKKLANHIKTVNKKGDFKLFNVVVMDFTKSTINNVKNKEKGIGKYPVDLGVIQIEGAAIRGTGVGAKVSDVVDIGAIVSANQSVIDLEKEDGVDNKMLRNQSNPLLIIYPLHPDVPVFKDLDVPFNKNLVPIGIALAFPQLTEDRTNQGHIKRYVQNKTVGVKS